MVDKKGSSVFLDFFRASGRSSGMMAYDLLNTTSAVRGFNPRGSSQRGRMKHANELRAMRKRSRRRSHFKSMRRR